MEKKYTPEELWEMSKILESNGYVVIDTNEPSDFIYFDKAHKFDSMDESDIKFLKNKCSREGYTLINGNNPEDILEELSLYDIVNYVESVGYLVYDDDEDALDHISDYTIASHVDVDIFDDDVLIRHLASKGYNIRTRSRHEINSIVDTTIEDAKYHVKDMFCDMFGLQHTVDNEEIINKIRETLK
jgi:hypothetical protein